MNPCQVDFLSELIRFIAIVDTELRVSDWLHNVVLILIPKITAFNIDGL